MNESKNKTCQNCKVEFTIEPEDFEFYQKVDVPPPTFCPECRMQRRMTFRTSTNLHERKVEGFNKKVLSCVAPSSPFRVLDSNFWWSDKMDAMKYGQAYDFNKPFFEQAKELMLRVGLPHLTNAKAVNSDYCNNSWGLKDCYLLFNAGLSEKCAFGTNIENSKDCYNNSYLAKCELCYEGFMLAGCYQTYFSSNCADCQEVFYSSSCINCQNCFGCVNLHHKKYHIFNKAYTKKKYFEELKKFDLGSYKNILSLDKKAKSFWLKFPVRFMHGRKNDNVTGEDIYNSKNVFNSHSIKDGEDMKYCQLILFWPSKECFDITVAGGELSYELEESGGYRTSFSWLNMPRNLKNSDAGLHSIEYCIGNFNSHDLFACVGLRHKQYCILNKQYTKESFGKLRTRIIQHMNDMPYTDKKGNVYKYGEFFPPELSPFAYNETIAQEHFALTKKRAEKKGYHWYDKPKNEYQATIKAKDLPDHIKDAKEDILEEIIECENEARDKCQGSGAFKIIPPEFKFYQKQKLPLPRFCPDCRHHERIKQRNLMKLYKRKCQCTGTHSENKIYQNQAEHSHKNEPCQNKFQTTYAPGREEIVYCEHCYQREVE